MFQETRSNSTGPLDGTNTNGYISEQYSPQTNNPSTYITTLTPLYYEQTMLPSIQSDAESIPLFSLADDSQVQSSGVSMSYIEETGILSSRF